MKAYLIDPFCLNLMEDGSGSYTGEPVTEIDIDYERNGIEAIYEALTHPDHEVKLFDVVRISDNGDAIFVDDEGLLMPRDHWFIWSGYKQPLAGRGLVLGTDSEGETTPPKLDLETVKRGVRIGTANIEAAGTGALYLHDTHVIEAWGFKPEAA